MLTHEIAPQIPFIKTVCKSNYLYYVNLDADDEYAVDFFERMLTFVTENQLDIAACGSDYINSDTGKTIRHKVLNKDLILEGPVFADQFPVYRNFTTTMWAEMFSVDLLRRCNFAWVNEPLTLLDSPLCLEAFRHAKRAGVLAQSLHRYFISSKTTSYEFNPYWFCIFKNLYENSKEYLLDYGNISKQNEDYLYVILLISIKYILPRIENADVGLSEKIKILNEIFADDATQYMLTHWTDVGIYSDRTEFLLELKNWIYAQPGWENFYPLMNGILKAIELK